jgi:hypothetical protein
VVVIELAYETIIKNTINVKVYDDESEIKIGVAGERTRYLYWIIQGVSITAMLLGIVYSFKRVFDPIIIEEERRNNEKSGEIMAQAE